MLTYDLDLWFVAPRRRSPSTHRFSCSDRCSPEHCGPRGAVSHDTHRSASISCPASTAPCYRRIGRTVPRLITNSSCDGDGKPDRRSSHRLAPAIAATVHATLAPDCARWRCMCFDVPMTSLSLFRRPPAPSFEFHTWNRSQWVFTKARSKKSFVIHISLPLASLRVASEDILSETFFWGKWSYLFKTKLWLINLKI